MALNAERAAEEAKGVIRWLRPEYQAHGARARLPGGGQAEQTEMEAGEVAAAPAPAKAAEKLPWPPTLPDQVRILRTLLAAQAVPATAETLCRGLVRADGEGRRTSSNPGHPRPCPPVGRWAVQRSVNRNRTGI